MYARIQKCKFDHDSAFPFPTNSRILQPTSQDPASVKPVEIVAARLLASPILQEYDAFTVEELGVHPAEFRKQANRTTLWKSQKLEGGKRTLAQTILNPSDQPVEAADAVAG